MALVKYWPIFKMAAIVNFRSADVDGFGYRRILIRWSWSRQWLRSF